MCMQVVFTRLMVHGSTSDVEQQVVRSVCYNFVFLPADEDDLRDVRSAVADLTGRWKDLGISLGIRWSTLDAIRSHSSNECLTEMLALWLKQNYNVRTTLIPA